MAIDERDYMKTHESVNKAIYNPKQFRDRLSKHEPCELPDKHQSTTLMTLLFAACIAAVFAAVAVKNHSTNSKTPTIQTDEPFPQSGTVRYYSHVDPSALVSTVAIQSAGGHQFNYVVRIRSPDTKAVFMDAYLRPGQAIEFGLPQGPYEAVVFMGTTWHGADRLFGDGRAPAQAGSPFMSSNGSRYNIALGAPISIEQPRR
jgi:hypothetical protein